MNMGLRSGLRGFRGGVTSGLVLVGVLTYAVGNSDTRNPFVSDEISGRYENWSVDTFRVGGARRVDLHDVERSLKIYATDFPGGEDFEVITGHEAGQVAEEISGDYIQSIWEKFRGEER